MTIKIYKGLLIFFFICFGAALLLSFKFIFKPKDKPEIEQAVNPNFLEDFSFASYAERNTQKKYVFAGKAIRFSNKKTDPFPLIIGYKRTLQIKNPNLAFYEQNTPVSVLTAKVAELDAPLGKGGVSLSDYQLINFLGNVVLMSVDNRILTCDYLTWDIKNDLLHARGNCALSSAGKITRGDLINTDAALKDFQVEDERLVLLSFNKGRVKQ